MLPLSQALIAGIIYAAMLSILAGGIWGLIKLTGGSDPRGSEIALIALAVAAGGGWVVAFYWG